MAKAPDAQELTRAMWRERALLHPDSGMYRGFFDKLRAGGDCLLPIEREQLGDLRGQRVLHLQCHLGQDSLSLARLGAEVTAIDYAPEAVDYARAMSSELQIPASFVAGDVLEARQHPQLREVAASFDWVFASYGVLCWISDLHQWMAVAEHFLRPGGRLLVVDTHPFAATMQDGVALDDARVHFPYFNREATRWDEAGSYAAEGAQTQANVSYEYTHRIGEIVNAAIAAGLVIEALDESAQGYWAMFPGQALQPDGHYKLADQDHGKLPLIFSLRARKP